mmetsp:Transcript_13988/g.50904  ORF Transcript_13988/g.50904 Transcript_13988/m.50904 type:complete len:211 (+) Transcript_13988:1861-2493(+)
MSCTRWGVFPLPDLAPSKGQVKGTSSSPRARSRSAAAADTRPYAVRIRSDASSRTRPRYSSFDSIKLRGACSTCEYCGSMPSTTICRISSRTILHSSIRPSRDNEYPVSASATTSKCSMAAFKPYWPRSVLVPSSIWSSCTNIAVLASRAFRRRTIFAGDMHSSEGRASGVRTSSVRAPPMASATCFDGGSWSSFFKYRRHNEGLRGGNR